MSPDMARLWSCGVGRRAVDFTGKPSSNEGIPPVPAAVYPSNYPSYEDLAKHHGFSLPILDIATVDVVVLQITKSSRFQ